jgi:NAD(P)-dependent dehydrogenase (short-subunit alcohol dehydrogenase family)
MELKDHVALITRGTPSVETEAARLLVREGAEVIIAGRDANRGAPAVADIGPDGGRVCLIASDARCAPRRMTPGPLRRPAPGLGASGGTPSAGQHHG